MYNININPKFSIYILFCVIWSPSRLSARWLFYFCVLFSNMYYNNINNNYTYTKGRQQWTTRWRTSTLLAQHLWIRGQKLSAKLIRSILNTSALNSISYSMVITVLKSLNTSLVVWLLRMMLLAITTLSLSRWLHQTNISNIVYFF